MLLVASLVTGGAAQWGWDQLNSPDDGRATLVIADPTATPGTTARNADRAGTVPSTPGSATPSRPGKRASRDADRTASPVATPRTTKPAPKPTPSAVAKPAPKPSATTDERTAIENEVIRLTNAQRTKNDPDCAPLRLDERLRDAARKHSDDMKARSYFDHVTPDGVDPWERAKAEGYTQPSGENIARGQPDAEAVVQAWMDSAGHRANILNCDSKAIGVGVTLGGDGPYWTQMFGFV